MSRSAGITKLRRVAIELITLLVVMATAFSFLATPPAKAAGTPVVFRVDSGGNITANGLAFRIKGGSWFGLQGRHEPSNDSVNPSGAPMEQYMGNVFWAPTSRTYVQDVNEFKSMGINVVRIPVSPQTLTGTDPQGMAPYLKNTASVVIPDSLTALKTVIQDLDAAGIYVLLDIHSCSNYVDWRKGRLDARPPYVDATRDNYDFKREDSSCSATNNPATVTRIQAYNETLWLQNLTQLANMETTLGVSNIIGIDIYNEPWDYTWADWSKLAGDAYTAINAVNPNILIFMEGTSDTANNQDGIAGNEVAQPYGVDPAPNWGGNLFSAGANPPAIPKDRLVFTPHVYGISVFVGKEFVSQTPAACAGLSGDAAGDAKCPLIMPPLATLQAGWDAQWGYLKAMGYAVVIGEFGGNMSWPGGKASLRDQNRYSYVTDHTIDAQWQQAFVNYLNAKNINDTIYWSINPESGDTGGLYTTPYDPVSDTGGWGTWGSLDTTKMTMLAKLWNAPIIGASPTNTPTPTATICVTCPTNTLTPTATRTSTATITNTPTPGLSVQIDKAGGTDNAQETTFNFRVVNTGATAMSNISTRIFFNADGSNAASSYVLEKFYDQSGVATYSAPTLACGSTYYITVTYGTASLPTGGQWEIQSALHLSSWASTYDGSNDFYHTGYAVGALPASYTTTAYIPVYVNGALASGSVPSCGPTATPTNTVVAPTSTPTRTPTVTNTPGAPTSTPTRTPTITNTPVGPTATPTRTPTITNTPVGPTATPTRTSVPPTATPTATVGTGACSPVTSTITAPFTFDGAGTFCWQASTLGSYINSWNLANLTINGVNITNGYTASGSYPAKINGFWYISYTGNFAWSHFETK